MAPTRPEVVTEMGLKKVRVLPQEDSCNRGRREEPRLGGVGDGLHTWPSPKVPVEVRRQTEQVAASGCSQNFMAASFLLW